MRVCVENQPHQRFTIQRNCIHRHKMNAVQYLNTVYERGAATDKQNEYGIKSEYGERVIEQERKQHRTLNVYNIHRQPSTQLRFQAAKPSRQR